MCASSPKAQEATVDRTGMETWTYRDASAKQPRFDISHKADVVVYVDGQAFPCDSHRLSTFSAYFRSTFLKSPPSSSSSVVVYNVDKNTFEELLRFIYSGSITITTVNLHSIVEACCMLGLPDELRRCCESLLQHYLSPYNAAEMLQFADTFNCHELFQNSLHMAVKHFRLISQTVSFKQLGKATLKQLLFDPRVLGLPDVYEALVSWLYFAPDARWEDFSSLVSQYTIMLIDKQSKLRGPGKMAASSPTTPKEPVCFFYLYGSSNYTQRSKALLWSPQNHAEGTASLKVSLPIDMGQEFAVSSFRGHSFVSGGNEHPLKMLHYDVTLQKWLNCQNMAVGRSRHVSAIVGNSVFVLGGYLLGSTLWSIEEYNIESRTWKEVGNLAVAVRSAACAVFKNCIYVFGGKTGDNTTVKTVQCFDPKTKVVHQLPDIPAVSSLARAVVLGELIYIANGQGSLICFDPVRETYEICQSQPIKRRHFGMLSVNGDLLVVGGKEQDTTGNFLADMYRYNPLLNKWTHVGYLPEPMAVFGTSPLEGVNS